ncbi:MAG: DUF1513 domain-containing protein [Polyangiales bacterium]
MDRAPAASTRATRRGVALGGGGFVSGGVERFVLAVIDLDRGAPAAEPVPTDFLPHGLAFHPRDRRRVAAFEKHGPGACELDLGARAVRRRIDTAPHRSFYGHGAYSADGAVLFATETVRATRAGVLIARDADTLAPLGEVPTHGLAPHDCALRPDGVMVVTHGGGPLDDDAPDARPCVTWVELASGRLLERLSLDSPRYNTGHLALGAGDALAVVSAPRDGLAPNTHRGALTLRATGRPAHTVEAPRPVVDRMLGETLSVVLDEARDLVAATNPLGDLLSFWRLDGACRGALSVRAPRGVALTLDGAWLLVSHLTERAPRLTALDANTLAPTGFYVDPSFVTGSHLAVHDA